MSLDLTALSQDEILGLTIIGEARGEPIEGQVGVGSVIRNRLHNHASKYRNYHDVCLAHEQFSCWNPSDKNYVYLIDLAAKMINGQSIDDPSIKQCLYVASGIVNWIIKDNTRGAEYYLESNLFYNTDKKPTWAAKSINVRQYGNQVFFSVSV